ncbi:MAG: electron transfer flavoprotein subunit alpha/FixB family protein [Pseudomonadota bacterium]
MSTDKDIWAFVEHRKGEIEGVSLEILSMGRQFADKLGETLNGVVFGHNHNEKLESLGGYGADRVYCLDGSLLATKSIEFYEEALFHFFEERKPRMILFGASLLGNEIACRIAVRFKTGLVSDCIGLTMNEDGSLLQTKLTHGGKMASTFICPFSRPQMATVKPGVLEKRKPIPDRRADVIPLNPPLEHVERRLKVKDIVKGDPEKIGLDEAEIIVSGGRGIGSPENFELLKIFAGSLGGAVGASLGAVDDGLAPRKKLVGQTGATVSPRLYIACGISGSIYHVLGMKDSGAIVSINKDRSAPIFKYSDMGLIGDALEIIPIITSRINKITERVSKERSGPVL